MKVKGISKIISLGKDSLSEYDFYGWGGSISPVMADVFIYSYSIGCYEGDGMAVWRRGGLWSYHQLGHCSCYGPIDNIKRSDGVKLTLTELIELLKNNYSEDYHKDSIIVREYLERYYK